MPLLKDLALDERPPVVSLRYANSTERINDPNLKIGDVERVARQLDDDSFWFLLGILPNRWKYIGNLEIGETAVTAHRGDHGASAYSHATTPHNKAFVGLGNVDNTSDALKPLSQAMIDALALKVSSILLDRTVGQGIPLAVDGKIPTSWLPMDVLDDVQEFPSLAQFPAVGSTTVFYVDATNPGVTYRWTGSGYAPANSSLALGSTAVTAHRGDHGAAAYAHAGVTHDKTLVGLSNVDNVKQIPFSQKGAANGVAAVGADNIILPEHRPIYGRNYQQVVVSAAVTNSYNVLTNNATGRITLTVPDTYESGTYEVEVFTVIRRSSTANFARFQIRANATNLLVPQQPTGLTALQIEMSDVNNTVPYTFKAQYTHTQGVSTVLNFFFWGSSTNSATSVQNTVMTSKRVM